jgi:hypothetical protein
MLALGIVAAVCQVLAHLLMVDAARPERNPVARYTVGCLVIFFVFWVGYELDHRQHPVSGVGYVILMSGIGTAACYYVRDRQRPRATGDTPDADKFLDALNREIDGS